MSTGSGSGSSSQSVTTSQQIPAYEQQFSQSNQDLARSLGSQSYPQYQGQLVAGFTPAQQTGQGMAIDAASSYQPLMNAGVATTAQAMTQSANDPNVVSSYMSPYLQSSLEPQIANLQTQLGQQQNSLNAQATQSGAFGDARQGVQAALNNYYGNQSLNSLISSGYNTAYNNAISAAQNQQNTLMTGGQQLSNMGTAAQTAGLTGANAVYNVGSQQQQNQQQQLNTAYQQYENQVQWPYQMLNVQESALSNSPYNLSSNISLPNANTTSQNLGMFSSLAGLLGSSGSSSGSSSNGNAPFGGQAYKG